MTKIIIILLFVFISQAFAEEQLCDEFAIRNNFKNELDKGTIKYTYKNDQFLGPIRDQGSIGFCYAYAGADLLEHWLKKNALMNNKEHLSGLAMGIMTQEKKWQYLLQDAQDQNYLDQDKLKKLKALDDEILKFTKKAELEASASLTGMTIDQLRAYSLVLNNNEKQFLNLHAKKDSLIKSLSLTTPQGGFPGNAIKKGMQYLCFESEVSSDGFKKWQNDLEANEKNSYWAEIFRGIGDLMVFLNIEKLEDNQEINCHYLKMAKTLFPGIIFEDVNELKSFVKNLPGNKLDDFLKQSCKDKHVIKSPIIKEEFEFSNLILKKENKKLEAIIDDALKKGNIAAIHYQSEILNNPKSKKILSGHHASVITGSISICGTQYYVLRNSWGKDSCQKSEFNLDEKITSTPDYKELVELEFNCEVAYQTELSALINKCEDDENKTSCIEKVNREKLPMLKSCKDNFHMAVQKMANTPVFCSENGDYLVRKEHLLKGSFGVTTIDEN